MKNLKLYALTILASGFLFSCKKDDNVSYTPPRDYGEQYANESVEIEEYLATHYLSGSGIGAIISEIPEGGNQTPLSEHPLLNSLIVKKHEQDYKLYYIKFNEGVGERPSHVDSVFVTYKGWLTDGSQFDHRPNPTWFMLDNLGVDGWSHIVSELKTGIYNEANDYFDDSGSLLVIIPSGLGYYQSSQVGIPAYSTLVFSINLHTLRYRDHDGDGIQSRFEARFFNENVEDTNANRDPRNYDFDGDEIPNYLDIDDDGDNIKTRYEIRKNENGDIYSFDQIKSCSEGGPKIHLDPSCSTPIYE